MQQRPPPSRKTKIIPPKVCDVTKFGAKGDNRTKDTAALNAAIAACAGGGTVLLPAPGKYGCVWI